MIRSHQSDSLRQIKKNCPHHSNGVAVMIWDLYKSNHDKCNLVYNNALMAPLSQFKVNT